MGQWFNEAMKMASLKRESEEKRDQRDTTIEGVIRKGAVHTRELKG